ncbi:rRNA maturation RNase YbeY [Candidatus Berkelbacteria bacterium RIFOXYA2_FULL_43_10]|uniref:Endoribonuclease YbeY n=1 Tax=Candidatus Berkelbacteria bacterium RIFOXYA2_FULL_43_10 TaxID=1797472 RepID=A0A1F5E3N2_9BACT|nr:MAG: rRNA maturation RNase YbeY [Candidatus Berkelbacteria bacterium RIFOXYA2_FULL_43_10]
MIKIEYFGRVGEREKKSFRRIANRTLIDSDEKSILLEVMFVSKKKIANLNLKFRSIDKVTDVLSFPQATVPGKESVFGTICICPEYAKEMGESLDLLFHHGLMHLMGYNHETNEPEWSKMYEKSKIPAER